MVNFNTLLSIFDNAGNDDERDFALHVVFSEVKPGPEFTLRQILETLVRLYYVDGWAAARTFFFMNTGRLLEDIDPEDYEDHVVEIYVASEQKDYEFPVRQIMSDCLMNPSPLNELYFVEEDETSDEESDYDWMSDEEEESESQSESETDEGETD